MLRGKMCDLKKFGPCPCSPPGLAPAWPQPGTSQAPTTGERRHKQSGTNEQHAPASPYRFYSGVHFYQFARSTSVGMRARRGNEAGAEQRPTLHRSCRAREMHAAAWLLVQLLAAQPGLDGLIDGMLRDEGSSLAASPAPDPQPLAELAPTPGLLSAALNVANTARRGPNGMLSIPLEEGHKARALSHGGSFVCANDCPNYGNIGSVVNDGYCDDGAPSAAYCADPSGSQYACENAVTNWCPLGHDCEDCGPRKVTNVCTCCAVRVDPFAARVTHFCRSGLGIP